VCRGDLDPTQPTVIMKIFDPTQPNPWINPTHGHVWSDVLSYLQTTQKSEETLQRHRTVFEQEAYLYRINSARRHSSYFGENLQLPWESPRINHIMPKTTVVYGLHARWRKFGSSFS